VIGGDGSEGYAARGGVKDLASGAGHFDHLKTSFHGSVAARHTSSGHILKSLSGLENGCEADHTSAAYGYERVVLEEGTLGDDEEKALEAVPRGTSTTTSPPAFRKIQWRASNLHVRDGWTFSM